MIDFQEFKAEKKGEATPLSIVNSVLNKIHEFEDIIIVGKDKNGEMRYLHSHMFTTQLLGMLEIVKQHKINTMD